MSEKLADLAIPFQPVSAQLDLAEYAAFLKEHRDHKIFVLLKARRPVCLLPARTFAQLLRLAAEHKLTPYEVFRPHFHKVPVLSGKLDLTRVLERLDEKGLAQLQSGCLIRTDKKISGLIDPQTLSLTLLKHGQMRASASPSETSPSPSENNVEMAMLAHEIRTPLTGMIGLSELLAGRLTDKTSRSMAASILRSAQALDRLLTDSLDFASLRADQFESLDEICDLKELAEGLEQIWTYEAARRQLSYEVDYWPDGPQNVRADFGRVKQIAHNLISNALKFTEQGKVCVSLACQQTHEEGLQLRLSVTDTGQGLTDEAVAIFQQAFAKGNAKPMDRGWGLGLAISHALAEKIGGELNYTRPASGGSQFTLSLPVQPVQMIHGRSPSKSEDKASNMQIGTLLLVDDHEASALIAQQILQSAGWQVDIAGSIHQAKERLSTISYRAILTDLHLPDGKAIELITHIRRYSPLNAQAPVLTITADMSEKCHQACLMAGADRVLRKPLQGPILMACLADLLMQKSVSATPDRLRGRLTA